MPKNVFQYWLIQVYFYYISLFVFKNKHNVYTFYSGLPYSKLNYCVVVF